MRLVLIFIFVAQLLFATDYDCLFIGTSPIPLFEAIYQRFSGKKVLIIEEAAECGGAWKTIDVCGLKRVDLGCHLLGGSRQLGEFLESYAGCNLVSLDNPYLPSNSVKNSFYFSKGCFELIDNLTRILEKSGVDLLLNHRLESVFIDTLEDHVVVKAKEKRFTAKKVFYTPMTSFTIENLSKQPRPVHPSKYYHLYLLIEDPTLPKFSYQGFGDSGASRVMNLTYFLDLHPLGQQLIVFQVHKEESLKNGEYFLEALKKKQLVSPGAYILKQEAHIYEGKSFSYGKLPPEWRPYFELLQTASFSTMSSHISRWTTVMLPYRELFPGL